MTGGLAGTELEHAHCVLHAVVGVLVSVLAPAFNVQQLERDAIFVHTMVDQRPDPMVRLGAVEQGNFAFRRHYAMSSPPHVRLQRLPPPRVDGVAG